MSNNRSIPVSHFDGLPIVEIYSHLSPEDVSNAAKVSLVFQHAAQDNLFWKEKFRRHFPHLFNTLSKQNDIDWQAQFRTTYREEYDYDKKKLPIDKIKLFSLVKEGDIKSLRAILKLSDLDLVDKNGVSLLEWAKRNEKDKQRLLNGIYEIVRPNYYYKFAISNYNKDVPGRVASTDPKRKDSKKRTILHLAILCHQPVNTVTSLIKEGADMHAVAADGYNALRLAAEEGQTGIAKFLIDNGASVNAHSGRGATPLLFAIENGHDDAVDLLIENGADINRPLRISSAYHDKFNVVADDTPLRAAIKLGRKEVVQTLLKKGADIHAVAADGSNALRLAAMEGRTEIAKLLIDKGAGVNDSSGMGATPLLLAIENGHDDVVDLLLEKNADINMPLLISSAYHDQFNVVAGDTPLRAAIKLGRKEVVQTLLKKGADIHAVAADGSNALRLAAMEGRTEIAKLLIDKGAGVNDSSGMGATPLLLAIENGHDDVVDLLLEKNADINMPLLISSAYHDQFNVVADDTPLRAAIKLGRKEVVQTLLKKGADINAVAADGHNALRLAAEGGHAEIVELLIGGGADVDVCSSMGATALLLATEHGHRNVVTALLRHNADICISLHTSSTYHDKFKAVVGDTPLHVASRLGHTAIMRRLHSKGANIETPNNQNQTPADVAVKGAKYVGELKLLHYAAKINRLPKDDQRKCFTMFGYKFNYGCSISQKQKAAEALKEVVFNGKEKSCLNAHKDALNSDELKPIYRGLRIK